MVMKELEEIKDILYTFSIKEALINVNYNDLNYIIRNAEDVDKRKALKQEDMDKLYIETYNQLKTLQPQPLQLKENDFKKTENFRLGQTFTFIKDDLRTIYRKHIKTNTYSAHIYISNINIYEKRGFDFKDECLEFINQKLLEIFNTVKGE